MSDAVIVPKEDVAFIKEYLTEQAEFQAEWRREKAAEYPDDERNLNCALSLELLATQLKAMPDDHPSFQKLALFWDDPDVSFEVTTEADIDPDHPLNLGRYGFDHCEPSADAEAWLSDLLEVFATAMCSD